MSGHWERGHEDENRVDQDALGRQGDIEKSQSSPKSPPVPPMESLSLGV